MSCSTTKEEDAAPPFSDVEIVSLMGSFTDDLSNMRITDETILNYEFELEINSVSGNYPDEIYVDGNPLLPSTQETSNGRVAGGPLFNRTYRSVSSVQITAKDLTGISTQGGSPSLVQNGRGFWFKCSFDISLRGEQCMGNTCPDRSLLGGRTWFCICTSNCEVGWN